MEQDNACAPALLLCGGTMGDRDAAIARLVEPAAQGQPIAVLWSRTGLLAGPDMHLRSHVVMRWVPIGCVCCTTAVMFRAALFQMLRGSRPARLVVDLGPGAHVATLEAQSQGESFARILRVVGRVDLDTGNAHAVSWPQ